MACWEKWPSGYLIGSPTRVQLPDGGIQPPAFICDWRISLSPWNRSMMQWSAN